MYLDKNKIIETLTKEDVIKLVTSLGSAPPKQGSKGELIFQTICHNENGGSYKLYYYHEGTDHYPSRIFHCYTECSDTFSIIELIIRAFRAKHKSITFYKALTYLANITGYNITIDKLEPPKKLINDWDFINKFNKNPVVQTAQFEPISEYYLDMFCYYPHEEFLKDNIDAETLSEFEIGYWAKTNQITIPHRDYMHQLVGIRGRFLDEEDVKAIGKYVPLRIEGKILNHELGSNLYGIHVNQEKIKQCKKVLILEGEKGVMQNHSYFKSDDFALATCGSNITAAQRHLLLNYLGVEEVILGYDKMFRENGTFEEVRYRNKIYSKIAPLLPYCKVSLLWDKHGLIEYKQSPTDYGKDVLLQLLDEKIEITMQDLEDAKHEMGEYEINE